MTPRAGSAKILSREEVAARFGPGRAMKLVFTNGCFDLLHVGHAMFLEEARGLAKIEPERFELGVGNWVTTRFSAEDPLPKKIWSSWLKESHAGATKGGGAKKKSARRKKA